MKIYHTACFVGTYNKKRFPVFGNSQKNTTLADIKVEIDKCLRTIQNYRDYKDFYSTDIFHYGKKLKSAEKNGEFSAITFYQARLENAQTEYDRYSNLLDEEHKTLRMQMKKYQDLKDKLENNR